MALSIVNTPTSQAAYYQEAYTIEESSSGIYGVADFKFIAVVKNGAGTQLAKFKFPIYPNSTNKGVVNVKRILETQVTSYFDLDLKNNSAAPCLEYDVEFGKYYSGSESLNEVSSSGWVANGMSGVLDKVPLVDFTERDIHDSELGWLYYNTFTAYVPLVNSETARYKSYSADGTLLKTVETGAGLQLEGRQRKVPVGANATAYASSVLSGSLPLIDPAAAYYTIEFGSYEQAIYYGNPIRYNRINTCSQYEGYTLNWLNAKGGFDSWYFQFKRIDSYEIQRQTMKRQRWELDGNVYAENTHKHAITNYINKSRQVITLNSDNLTTEQAEFLKGLFFSPEVYLLDGVDYYPVNVQADGYEQKKNINDDVFNVTVRCLISDFERTQRL